MPQRMKLVSRRQQRTVRPQPPLRIPSPLSLSEALGSVCLLTLSQQLPPPSLALPTPPVKALIEHEMKNGIPANRIVLGGFSQVRRL